MNAEFDNMTDMAIIQKMNVNEHALEKQAAVPSNCDKNVSGLYSALYQSGELRDPGSFGNDGHDSMVSNEQVTYLGANS